MPNTGRSGRRMSALQRKILVILEALNEHGSCPVATRDIERILENGGDKPVYGSNLRAACRKLEEAGFLNTLRARNLQLAVQLTQSGHTIAASLLAEERLRDKERERARECFILPTRPPHEQLIEIEVEIDGKYYLVCHCDYVIRLNRTFCLQLWRINGRVTRIEGDALQIAQWYQQCYDANVSCRVQVNESKTLNKKVVS
ncbi:hypothetical protein DMS23_07905 [Klebsiella variicola]|nr:hypothetical protein DMS23_07905 [Klebsiella variicola]